MVIVLEDQFRHLAQRIFPAAGHMGGNVRNLRPDYQALLIAQVVEILVVLVMGQTDSGETAFQDHIDIFRMMLRQQGVADTQTVLVTGNTAEGIFFAVEDEATVGIDLIGAAAETGGDSVAVLQLHGSGVQVRILPAIPLADVLDGEADLGLSGGGFGHNCAFPVGDDIGQSLAFRVLGPDFDLHAGIVAVNDGGHLDAGSAMVSQIKVGFGNADQIHIPVQAAIEGKVSVLGIDLFVDRVFHSEDHKVAALHHIRHIHTPGGVAAIMVGKVLAIPVKVSGSVGAVDLQEVPLTFGQIDLVDGLGIIAGATVVVTAAVLTINGVPCMGQVDPVPIFRHSGRDCSRLLGKC